MKKQNKKILFITLPILLILLVAGLGVYYYNVPSQETLSSNTRLAIPHFGAYKCDITQDKYGISVNIPSGGSVISKSNVGFYTNGISNIKLSFTNSYWSTDWATRAGYAICDTNGNNCGSYTYITDWVGGTKTLPINSIDFSTSSIKLIYQRIPVYIIGGWQNSEGLKASFDSKSFGLKYYSTTNNPAGTTICSTSCDLSCPDIGYRKTIVYDCNGNAECNKGKSDKSGDGIIKSNVVDFYDSTPTFEYWEDISYDLNAQGGANVYNSNTKQFCFAGSVYSSTTITLNGITYIYPNTNTKQQKLCCPGATISSTYSDKICQSDYTWKVIQDTDKLTCISDVNCPNAGSQICQNKQLSSGYSCKNKDANNIGLCQKGASSSVQCCINADCSKDQICDTSSHTCKGGTTLPVCGDGNINIGEECDDGSNNGKDGSKCTATCQKIIVEVPQNQTGDCQSCTQWALNIFKSEDKKCTSTSAVGSATWYNPLSYWKVIGNATGLTSQNVLCPIAIGLTIVFILIVLFVLMIILLGFAGVALLFKRLFSKGKKR